MSQQTRAPVKIESLKPADAMTLLKAWQFTEDGNRGSKVMFKSPRNNGHVGIIMPKAGASARVGLHGPLKTAARLLGITTRQFLEGPPQVTEAVSKLVTESLATDPFAFDGLDAARMGDRVVEADLAATQARKKMAKSARERAEQERWEAEAQRLADKEKAKAAKAEARAAELLNTTIEPGERSDIRRIETVEGGENVSKTRTHSPKPFEGTIQAAVTQWFVDHPRVVTNPDKLAEALQIERRRVLAALSPIYKKGLLKGFERLGGGQYVYNPEANGNGTTTTPVSPVSPVSPVVSGESTSDPLYLEVLGDLGQGVLLLAGSDGKRYVAKLAEFDPAALLG